ncbi:Ubiquinone biosynthesis O-methyltransferase [Polystyrenella longa]|uniref:Ubiquinone biosynthesis O-methyltransferase n=1 Tax=Polystyrenella longa TaxID=2528007 RepID=A0A518CM01_9PLAN|nr:methyltransferase domain-containing protein [Polystyrenella longa]QDU80223.1 Ubiquinone biosynthesis O-methyltransferase [Polystyrenella longa]
MSFALESLPLRCPLDQHSLESLFDQQALTCPQCHRVVPIQNGIPRFVEDAHLESFGTQWTRYDVAHEQEDRRTFEAKTGFRRDELKGKRVLDAGCGGGRYTRLVAAAGGYVSAVDHTRAVDKAVELCRDESANNSEQIQFLQADLKNLPFAPASFDYVFSIGVMHHDEETRAVFNAVARLVKPGGYYSVWLYRRNQEWQEKINNWLRCRTTTMPQERLEKWSRRGAILGRIPLLNRVANKVVNFSSHPNHENRVCDTFDWYAPQYQHHHTIAELLDWYESAGFHNLEVLPPEKTGYLYNWAYDKDLIIGSGVNVRGQRPVD